MVSEVKHLDRQTDRQTSTVYKKVIKPALKCLSKWQYNTVSSCLSVYTLAHRHFRRNDITPSHFVCYFRLPCSSRYVCILRQVVLPNSLQGKLLEEFNFPTVTQMSAYGWKRFHFKCVSCSILFTNEYRNVNSSGIFCLHNIEPTHVSCVGSTNKQVLSVVIKFHRLDEDIPCWYKARRIFVIVITIICTMDFNR